MAPAISARGITPKQAMMPNVITHEFRTGSRKGPIKTTAIDRAQCPPVVRWCLIGLVLQVTNTPTPFIANSGQND